LACLKRRGGAPQALSLSGNRRLNYALHMVATCQARSDARGGVIYRKKMAEGKSRKEALRCLKRRVCDAILQEPRGGFSGAFAQRRLIKRSRERRQGEVRRIPLPRTPVNKSMKKDLGCYRPRPSPSTSSSLELVQTTQARSLKLAIVVPLHHLAPTWVSVVITSTYHSFGTPLQRACSPSGCRCPRSYGGSSPWRSSGDRRIWRGCRPRGSP
jgi:hypothetical protein